MRVIAGDMARAPPEGPAGRRAPARPPTACARRCSRSWATASHGRARARPVRRLGRARPRGALARRRGGHLRRRRAAPRSRRSRPTSRRSARDAEVRRSRRPALPRRAHRAAAPNTISSSSTRRTGWRSASRAPLSEALPAVLAPGAVAVAESDRRAPLDARPAPPRRTPLRRHPHPHPWPPIPASPSAPAPTTRSRNGHVDVITRAAAMFDELIVAVVNASVRKSKSLFTAEERIGFIEHATAHLRQRPRGAVRQARRRLRARAGGQGDRQGTARDLGLRVRAGDEPAQPLSWPPTSSPST